MEKNADIDQALENFKNNAVRYEKTTRYYKGDHDLQFASVKFKNAFGDLFREFALNLCPAVIDAVKDNLRIKEFRVESGESSIGDKAWFLWQANRMGRRAGQVHKEAAKNGDSYVMVWVDPNKNVTIYPQSARSCTVNYSEEIPGQILWAAKQWQTPDLSVNAKKGDKKTRLNLYYPDRTERFISKGKTTTLPAKSTEFVEFADLEGKYIIPNPYGIVPIFHFGNNSDIGELGISEISSTIPVQDALNKSVLDMLVAMEFASYRQRWASGIEIEYDEETGAAIPPYKSGIDRLWISESENAKFGDFEAANLEQFLKVKTDFRTDIACVSGTPLYYFMLVEGTAPSGESIKKAETRFIKKILDRMETFGQVWEDVMQFALLIDNKGKDIRLFTEWFDAAPVDEKEKLENIVIKKDGIGISEEQAMIEAGYGLADIERMKTEKQASADASVTDFNAGIV